MTCKLEAIAGESQSACSSTFPPTTYSPSQTKGGREAGWETCLRGEEQSVPAFLTLFTSTVLCPQAIRGMKLINKGYLLSWTTGWL